MSKTSPPQDIESTIKAHGKKVEEESSAKEDPIGERLDKLELFMEQSGKTAELSFELSNYIKELREETGRLKTIRNIVVVFAISFVVFMIGMLVCLMYFRPIWFLFQGQYFKTAIFVSTLASCVILISIVLRGSFRTIADRNSDDVMPPHLKETIEAVRAILGK